MLLERKEKRRYLCISCIAGLGRMSHSGSMYAYALETAYLAIVIEIV